MPNTTLTEPQTAPSVTFTELNVRQDNGKPHFVRLHDSVVKGLEKHLKSSTGDSSGLLLGSIETSENLTISVEEFEPVARIEEGIRSKSTCTVVGYYRTYSQAEFAPDASDRSLYQRSFPKDSRLVLLVRPPKTDIGTAMFFLGQNGQLTSERATVEFPFNLRELGAEDPAPAPKPAAPAPVVAAAPKPVTPVAPPAAKPMAAPVPVAAKPAAPAAAAKAVKDEKSSGSGAFWKIAVAGVVVVGSGLGLNSLGVFNRQTEAPAAVESPAPVVQEAEPAPATPASERPRPTPTPKQETANPAAKPAAATTAAVVAPASRKSTPAATAPTPAPVETRRTTTTTPALPVQTASTPPVTPPVAQPAAAAPAPETRPTPPPTVARQDPTPAPTPIQTAPTTSAQNIRPVEPARTVIAPRAIRQVAPMMVDKVRRSLEGEMTVKVRAYVDAAGKVTHIEPLSGGSPMADALSITAINAVRRWQFEPARRGDEKVAGDVELSFTFRK